MIRLGICNELFENWEFGQVCRTVKDLGYDGLEIAPFTLAPTDHGPLAWCCGVASCRATGRGRGAGDDRPALAAGQDRRDLYLTSPDPAVRPRDGRVPGRAWPRSTRDLGGTLMVLGLAEACAASLPRRVVRTTAPGYAAEVL